MTREEITTRLGEVGYVADRDLATALWLMEFLQTPAASRRRGGSRQDRGGEGARGHPQGGADPPPVLRGPRPERCAHEWNYQRQLLAIKAREGADADEIEEHIFSERYLLERPLLAAIRRLDPPVLLIDEVDRADEEFEAFLLELLSDFQVSIPELGTITATAIPRVVLTSNGTRELVIPAKAGTQ